MKFEDLPLAGSKLVHGEPIADARGYFERIFCVNTFGVEHTAMEARQISVSWNEQMGTRRGLHFQIGDAAEGKLVRCISGQAFDVIVDIRPSSPTFGKSHAVILSDDNHLSVYVPPGFAHGFQTMKDGTALLYLISKDHSPQHARGISSEDPALAIAWPSTPTRMSDADRGLPSLAGFMGGAA
jgi:dTDP-4-dehydrorhamnose 3,5-epimerase